ncbi:hypothetical protein CABS03_01686 [Colletotrichum abscissum]|uniref:Uncharacterized protein n=1 Tax=Colletotrichum limetticola TaxID=1209924 RepID=A0ABQ9PC97_9PEZI|nr:hypothetical protein CLIM01_12951 [Colletotrichum limetticola]
MSYNICTLEYLGSPNHVAIFIEDGQHGSGTIYHVIGNILVGMEFQIKPAKRPDLSESFVPGTQRQLGRIQKADVVSFEALCRSVPPPGAQLKLNGRPKDPSKPIRRCGEWVHEVADKALSQGIITR